MSLFSVDNFYGCNQKQFYIAYWVTQMISQNDFDIRSVVVYMHINAQLPQILDTLFLDGL